MRLAAHALAPLTLIRPPQPDELEAVAQVADRVLLCDVAAARAIGAHAPGAPVEVLLTVDLGDRREGVLPEAVPRAAAELGRLHGIDLAGIAVNFACLSGQLPSRLLFEQAEALLAGIADLCAAEPVLSLGGTCCVQSLDGYRPRFRTELRSGGGPLYGYDFVSGRGIAGMARTDPVLTAVVLECGLKPPAPPGARGLDAFGHVPEVSLPDEDAYYALLNLGRRDCEPGGLRPLLPGSYLAGATSDVSVLITPDRWPRATWCRSPSTTTPWCAPSPPLRGVRRRRSSHDTQSRRTPTVATSVRAGRSEILAADDVARIHEASLDVLAETRRDVPLAAGPGRARGARRRRGP